MHINSEYTQDETIEKKSLTEKEIEENRLNHIEYEKRVDKFDKKLKKDMGDVMSDFIEFITILTLQDSENLHIETDNGESYKLYYQEPENTNNNTIGSTSTSLNPQPSNFNIAIRRNQVVIETYNRKENNNHRLPHITTLHITDNNIYEKIEKIVYETYIKFTKKNINAKIIDMYKISKLDRQRKIKNILNDNEQ